MSDTETGTAHGRSPIRVMMLDVVKAGVIAIAAVAFTGLCKLIGELVRVNGLPAPEWKPHPIEMLVLDVFTGALYVSVVLIAALLVFAWYASAERRTSE